MYSPYSEYRFCFLFLSVGTYIVDCDYKAKSSDELTIRKGDIITDASPSENGWLKGECRGKIGHFPENYVTPINKEKIKKRTFKSSQTEKRSEAIRKRSLPSNDNRSLNSSLFQVRAIYTYLPIHNDELSIKPNDIITVTRLIEKGWYEGTVDGKTGVFPSNYVVRISDDKAKTTHQLIKQNSLNNSQSVSVKQEIPKTALLSTKARVLFDYKAADADELTLTTNDIVTVIDKNLQDKGWWKGELNGKIGVFPDNFVQEISTSPTLKHRTTTPDAQSQSPTRKLSKATSHDQDPSLHYFNERSSKIKPKSISTDEENKYSDAGETSQGTTTQKPTLTNRSSSVTRKNENELNKVNDSPDEPNRPQSFDTKNESKIFAPSPPPYQRDPNQLESPRYTNRSFTLLNSREYPLATSVESRYFQSTASTAIEQLRTELTRLKTSVDEMNTHLSDQIQDLMNELDEEKKVRATLQIEIERLQKLFQKSSRINS